MHLVNVFDPKKNYSWAPGFCTRNSLLLLYNMLIPTVRGDPHINNNSQGSHKYSFMLSRLLTRVTFVQLQHFRNILLKMSRC